MVSKEEITTLLWQHVSIAIPHRFHDGLFWYTGQLVNSKSDNFVVIRKDPDQSLLKIPLEDIIEIKPSTKQRYKNLKKRRGY